MVIAAGRNDGSRVYDAVITDLGLVGQVSKALRDTALVTLLTDPATAVTAKDSRTGAIGIVQHSQGAEDLLFLDSVGKDKRVDRGDLVVTAGKQSGKKLSSFYPRGIPIGQVTKVGIDALGRTTWVDLPGRTTTPHSIEYSYTNTVNQPSTVTTKVLQTDGGAVATSRSWTDGWGRPVESQRLNAAGTGRIVSSTSYDERGLVWASVPSGTIRPVRLRTSNRLISSGVARACCSACTRTW